MAKNLSLNVLLGLQAQKFNAGLRRVEASLNRMRMKFRSFAATMGVGLGFGEMVRSMVQNAKSMDQASTTLRNVSNGFEELAENQKYIMELSKEYNQDIIVLTNNFAKFHSAGTQSKMMLEDQKKVFESLTRASAFFNLSADETNGVFLAITQMMSKGRVASEELRRQLGERLPGAFGIMAQALGMSTGQLEEAMKKGEVYAKDALPKFAEALNQITRALDVNTIQGSTNKVKNAFTSMVKSFKIDKTVKKVLNSIADGIDWLANHTKTVISNTFGIIGGMLGQKLFNKYTNARQAFVKDLEKDLAGIERDARMLERTQSQRLARISRTSEYFEFHMPDKPGGDYQITDKKRIFDDNGKLLVEAEKEYNKLQKEVYRQKAETLDMQNRIAAQQSVINKRTGFWKSLIKGVGLTLKAAVSSVLAGAILGTITHIITKFARAKKEMKDFLRYVDKMNKEFEKTRKNLGSDGELMKEMKKRVELDEDKPVKDGKLNFKNRFEDIERADAVKSINTLLGLKDDEQLKDERTLENYQKINQLLQDRIDLIQNAVDLQAKEKLMEDAINTRNNKQDELNKLRQSIANDQSNLAHVKEHPNMYPDPFQEQINWTSTIASKTKDAEDLQKGLDALNAQIQAYTDDIVALREKLGVEEENAQNIETISEVQSNYEDIQAKYNKELAILKDKLKRKLITEAEYDKELKDLTESTIDEIYALDKSKFATDEFAKKMLEQALALKSADKLAEIENEYHDSVKKLKDRKDAGLITEDEYQESMSELTRKTMEAIVALGDLNLLLQGFGKDIDSAFLKDKADQKHKKDIEEATAKSERFKDITKDMPTEPDFSKIDHTFDYNKDQSEKLHEVEEVWDNYAKKLESIITELKDEFKNGEFDYQINKMSEALANAAGNAKTFKDAANFAKIAEDVKRLKTEAFDDVVNSFSNVAASIENIQEGVKSMMDTFEDPETDGWDHFLAVLNMISQTVDGIFRSIQMMEKVTEVFDKLKAAINAQKAAEKAMTAASIAQSGTKIAAKTAEASAEAGASAAGAAPFPLNLVLVAAAIAAMAALFSQIPKFANGGIIGGHSSNGDKLLARVNSGEMILNKAQQASMYNMLSKKNNGVGEVQFKIRGADLVGTLDNYNRKMTR